MRLTRHFTKNEIKSFELLDGNPDNFTTEDYCNAHNDDLYANRRIHNKLGKLEDIEEDHNIKSVDDLDKRLIALEIIKEKKWLVEDILDAYVENQDEYNLLKEVLE